MAITEQDGKQRNNVNTKPSVFNVNKTPATFTFLKLERISLLNCFIRPVTREQESWNTFTEISCDEICHMYRESWVKIKSLAASLPVGGVTGRAGGRELHTVAGGQPLLVSTTKLEVNFIF